MALDEVLTCVQNLERGHRPLKFGKAKNVQNSARFKTTFNVDCKYLWKGLRHRQAVNGVINYCSFCLKQKMMNFGPLTTKLCLLISTYPKSSKLGPQFRGLRKTVGPIYHRPNYTQRIA